MRKLLIMIMCFATIPIFGQTPNNYIVDWDNEMWNLVEPQSNVRWLTFKENSDIQSNTFFEEVGPLLGLSSLDQFELVSTNEGRSGMSHHRYRQIHDGIPVQDHQFILHSLNGKVKKANGDLGRNLEINSSPSITSSQAFMNAINSVDVEKFEWERVGFQSDEFEDISNGQLVIYGINPNKQNATYKLAYKFLLRSYEAHQYSSYVYVDAHSGELIAEENLIKGACSCNNSTTGTATTMFNGNRSIGTNKDILGKYSLKDCGRDILTSEYDGSVWDAVHNGYSNTWGSGKAVFSQAHWGVSMAYDYFKNVWSRNGIDNNSSCLDVYVQHNSTGLPKQSEFDSSNDKIYTGSGYTIPNVHSQMVSLDIMAHEFTHGVLKYLYAPTGAVHEANSIEEAVCDIFGAAIENYSLGGTPYSGTYEQGEDVSTPPIRYMNDPHNSGLYVQPECYQETGYWDFTGTTGSKSYNMGVMNYWFYLLSEGSSGPQTSSCGNSYNLTGIGIDDAVDIVYYGMLNYFTSYTNYSDAKNATIWAAFEGFGGCTFELAETIRAWDAVNVTSGSLYYSRVVNCSNLSTIHNTPAPFSEAAINDIEIDCGISNNGYLVEITAGKSVSMKPGFTSGTNYRAYIDDCFNLVQYRKGSKKENNSPTSPESITDNDEHKLSIYPNPNDGNFTFLSSIGGEIKVYDIRGTLVYGRTVKEDEGKLKLSLDHLGAGMYVLNFVSLNQVQSERIVIQ